ncbi:MAG: HAMP domain-containing histidine kinase [Gammaproteobacteria bacterium]|nr:HAMP domain-containing histidine kinase [Gammaproteobacteria bacterium]
MKRQRISIRRRIILAFCLLALLISSVYTAYTFLFAYSIEDEFFNRTVAEESAYILDYFEQYQSLPQPRQSFIAYYPSSDVLPEDLKSLYLEESWRREFPGLEGRYYHVTTLAQAPHTIVVAEVSQLLVVRAMTPDLLAFYGISTFVVLLIAFAIAFILAQRSLKPLLHLSQLVDKSSPQQLPKNLSQQFNQREIYQLAKALDDALLRVNTFIEREQHFTRDVSHELRTPITVIKGAVELLRQASLAQEDRVILQRIDVALTQAEQTITTLLALAREENDRRPEQDKSDRNKPELASNKTALLPIVEQVIIDHAYLIDNKSIDVNVAVTSDVQVSMQPTMLNILLANLIGNAFRYTAEGSITIAFEQQQLIVEDTGQGFDSELIEKAFNTFAKGCGSQGFGIGLSIVKRICEQQGLAIKIEAKQQGTRVVVAF